MTTRIVAISDLSEDDIRKWRELAARSISPSPMAEPDCILPAVQYLRNGPKIKLVIAERDDRFLVCAPVQIVPRWRSISRTTLSTRVRRMTWDATPLVDRDEGTLALKSLLFDLSKLAGKELPSLMAFEWLNGRDQVVSLLRGAADDLSLPWRTYDSWDQPFLTRAEPELAQRVHSKKTLSTRDRKLRGLAREIGGEARVVDHRGDPAAAVRYAEVEASGYKLAGGVAMTAQFGELEWFRAMAAAFGERFHALSLEVGDTIVAMECLVRSQDTYSMFKWSYDQRYEKYSPGALLHLATLKWFQEDTDATHLDICTYKDNRFVLGEYPETRPVVTMVLGLRGPQDAKWLNMLRFDRAFRAGVFKLGVRLKISTATLSMFCDGGDYGRLDWKRAAE